MKSTNANEHNVMQMTVVGSGYVGLVTALCFAEQGHHVTCLDADKEKIERLRKGDSVIYEPQVADLLSSHHKQMQFVTQAKKALPNASVIIVAVGTPERSDGSANLSYFYDALRAIAKHAHSDAIVVIKSTVPVGTGDQAQQFLHAQAPDKQLQVVSNPEFLAQGTAVRDTMHPERIVIGLATAEQANNQTLEATMRHLYATVEAPILFTNRRSAELIKYASNNFLALKISFINEMANLCEIVGANVEAVSHGIGLDSRIGDKFLRAGTGYGGSCFPKDTKALHWLANFHDYEIKTVKAAIEVNENQKLKLIKKARALLGSLKTLRIAVLGVTFKPHTDDLRESPAVPCISLLLEEEAEVSVFDPRGLDHLKQLFGRKLTYAKTVEQALKRADVCLIFTEWPEIVQLNLKKYKRHMKRALVLDGRNCYRLEDAVRHGIEYVSIGRPAVMANDDPFII